MYSKDGLVAREALSGLLSTLLLSQETIATAKKMQVKIPFWIRILAMMKK
jgi:hypothetical protein